MDCLEGMEDDQEISVSKVDDGEGDEAVLRMLHLMNERIAAMLDIDRMLRSGWLHLAKVKYASSVGVCVGTTEPAINRLVRVIDTGNSDVDCSWPTISAKQCRNDEEDSGSVGQTTSFIGRSQSTVHCADSFHAVALRCCDLVNIDNEMRYLLAK